MSADPLVDLVIACHSAGRPVGRAVRSVLRGRAAPVRVTVVCHNQPADVIGAALDEEHRDQVRLLEHTDPAPSASGPFNAGLDAATAPWVSILGSDDQLEPGAVDSWLRLARAGDTDAVITRQRLGAARRGVATPPTRPGRRRDLDLVRDRLSYRSAPLGLLRRSFLDGHGIRLVEGARVGGDIPFVIRLWAEGRIAYDRSGPAYLVGEDATDRVTYRPKPVAHDLAFLDHLLAEEWFVALPLRARAAVAVKLTRVNLFAAVANRPDPATWTPDERRALADAARRVAGAAPGYERVLSLADRDLLDAVRQPDADAATMIRHARMRQRHGRPRTVVTRDLGAMLAREAPIRFMAASILAR